MLNAKLKYKNGVLHNKGKKENKSSSQAIQA
jgi:hypothetical protein